VVANTEAVEVQDTEMAERTVVNKLQGIAIEKMILE
jgi:hypothetical protein